MLDTEAVQRLRQRWTALREGLAEYYAGPYRQTLARERRGSRNGETTQGVNDAHQ